MPFADDVRSGLTARPKTLPPKYFYDQLGSTLFEAISLLPEYYLTRAEAEILTAHARDIIASVQPARLIELGSGSAVKTRYLIEAGLHLRGAIEYTAIDISQTVLETSGKALQAQYPQLTVRSYQGDYYEGLRMLPRVNAADQRTLALFLGSNIGNFDPPEALRFLRAIRAVLEPGDALLLGTDLKKDRAVLEAAYDDPIGVTAAFDLNILARINRELGGEFELRAFRHRAVYNEAAGRVEMHLVSTVHQVVPIRALALDVSFAADETIHTESSYKFSPDDLERLAHDAGFDLQRSWTDAANRFACSLLRCAVPKAK
ncbi:MAG: L-histidine N(alpha)-methyltransferase [Candidatus Eremiobacteraeota bacterium]|nr:L-histidine N(alpha)-methyltransferase [Candidatus Eremiobacteraeota bacterium]